MLRQGLDSWQGAVHEFLAAPQEIQGLGWPQRRRQAAPGGERGRALHQSRFSDFFFSASLEAAALLGLAAPPAAAATPDPEAAAPAGLPSAAAAVPSALTALAPPAAVSTEGFLAWMLVMRRAFLANSSKPSSSSLPASSFSAAPGQREGVAVMVAWLLTQTQAGQGVMHCPRKRRLEEQAAPTHHSLQPQGQALQRQARWSGGAHPTLRWAQ